MTPITTPLDLERREYKGIKRSSSTLSLSDWIPDYDSCMLDPTTNKLSAERLLLCGVLLVALGVMHVITAWHWNRRGMTALAPGVAACLVGACQLGWGLEQQVAATAWYGSGSGSGSSSSSKKWARSTRGQVSTLAVAVLGAYLLVGLLIHCWSGDITVYGFPDCCPAHKELGCSRIAETNHHRNLGARPLQLHASLEDVHTMVQAWVRQQPGAVVLNDFFNAGPPRSLIHARFASAFWGFADDVFISARCENHVAVLEVQGQLRWGVGDLDVNRERNLRFMSHVQQEVAKHLLPAGNCRQGSLRLTEMELRSGNTAPLQHRV